VLNRSSLFLCDKNIFCLDCLPWLIAASGPRRLRSRISPRSFWHLA
jgi:hypothetical protein